MDHHSPQPLDDDAKSELLKQQQELVESLVGKLGPTGSFPQGKLTESDEGELMFSVTTYRGQVIINFNSPVQWAGLNPDQALALADALRRRAHEAERYVKSN